MFWRNIVKLNFYPLNFIGAWYDFLNFFIGNFFGDFVFRYSNWFGHKSNGMLANLLVILSANYYANGKDNCFLFCGHGFDISLLKTVREMVAISKWFDTEFRTLPDFTINKTTSRHIYPI